MAGQPSRSSWAGLHQRAGPKVSILLSRPATVYVTLSSFFFLPSFSSVSRREEEEEKKRRSSSSSNQTVWPPLKSLELRERIDVAAAASFFFLVVVFISSFAGFFFSSLLINQFSAPSGSLLACNVNNKLDGNILFPPVYLIGSFGWAMTTFFFFY